MTALESALLTAPTDRARLNALNNLAAYWQTREPALALDAARRALTLAEGEQAEHSEQLMTAHEHLYRAYKTTGDFVKALDHHEALYQLSVELQEIHVAAAVQLEHERVTSLRKLLSGMYHDLMTPVSIIKTSLYLLGKMKHDDEKAISRRQLMQSALEALVEKIKKMVTLAKLDSDMPGFFNPAPHLVEEIIESALSIVHPERDTQTRVLINNKCPGTKLMVDEVLLPTALAELLDNALRYSDKQARVNLKIAQTDDTVAIEIKDKGCGISEEMLPVLFDRFYLKGGRRTSDNNNGLGLPLAHKIIETHGGSIQVESVVNEGTVFRIEIPTQSASVVEAVRTDVIPT